MGACGGVLAILLVVLVVWLALIGPILLLSTPHNNNETHPDYVYSYSAFQIVSTFVLGIGIILKARVNWIHRYGSSLGLGIFWGVWLFVMQLLAGVFGILTLVYGWDESLSVLDKVILISGLTIPAICCNIFLGMLVGGIALAFMPGWLWVSDILRPKRKWAGKHVLITGGGTGTGKALAKLLAQKGANLTLISRNAENLENAKKEAINTSGAENFKPLLSTSQIECVPCDLTDPAQVSVCMDRIVQRSGIPDVIITSHGISIPGYWEDQSLDLAHRHMDINYWGVVNITKAALPYFLNRGGGEFLFISSALALTGMFGYPNYCGSKYAVRGFMEAMRSEYRRHNIHFYNFCPSNIDTPSFAEEMKTKPSETVALDNAASTISAETAGKICLAGFERGNSVTTTEMGLELLRMSGNGCVPSPDPVLEYLLFPTYFIGISVLRWIWDSTVHNMEKECECKEIASY